MELITMLENTSSMRPNHTQFYSLLQKKPTKRGNIEFLNPQIVDSVKKVSLK